MPFAASFKALFITGLLSVGILAQTAHAAADLNLYKCWEYAADSVGGATIAVRSDRLYVVLDDGRVDALFSDGRKAWTSDLGGSVVSDILTTDEGVAIVTAATGSEAGTPATLTMLSGETGITEWTAKLSPAASYTLGRSADTLIVVLSSGKIASYHANDGKLLWQRDLADRFVAGPVIADGRVVVSTGTKQVFTVSLSGGSIEALTKISTDPTALGRTADGTLIVGDDKGAVEAYAADGRPSWAFRTGGAISSVAIVGTDVIVSSNDNFVYLLRLRNGGVGWKRRFAGRLLKTSGIADKYTVISSQEDHGLVIADNANGRVIGRITLTHDEIFAAAPIATPERVYFLSNKAAYAYGIGGCGGPKNESGADTTSTPLL